MSREREVPRGPKSQSVRTLEEDSGTEREDDSDDDLIYAGRELGFDQVRPDFLKLLTYGSVWVV